MMFTKMLMVKRFKEKIVRQFFGTTGMIGLVSNAISTGDHYVVQAPYVTTYA